MCHPDTKKCVFVRVVDTCAGCARGSKHVDMTKGAFSQLASLDEGMLMVHARRATDPQDGWSVFSSLLLVEILTNISFVGLSTFGDLKKFDNWICR